MIRLRRGDTVVVLSGRDKGKTGRVIHVYPSALTALVEGVNYVKRHLRRTREDRPSGIVQKELPVALGKLAVVCPRCNRGARMSVTVMGDGTRARACKRCHEVIKT